MKFSYSAVWADTVALLRSHVSLLLTVAGVFLFLPTLLVAHLLPQPEATSFERLGQLWGEYASANWHWLLLSRLIGMIGSIAILLLVFSRGITVGGAIAGAVALLPPYFLALLLGSLAIGIGFLILTVPGLYLLGQLGPVAPVVKVIGFLLLIAPGLYLLGRLGPLNPVVVAEGHRNPIAALRRCWALTEGHGWAVLGLILIVAIAAAIVVSVASSLLGIVFVLVAGRDVGALLTLIVATAGNAAMMTLLLVLGAAIYRELSGERSAAGAAPAAGSRAD